MDKMIAYCGLDCSKCEAYLATINNDDSLREKVAAKWSKLNNILITPDQINCEGCKADGVKTIFCDKLCEIRKCAKDKYENCGKCNKLNTCEKIKMIISNNDEAIHNLKSNR